MITFPNCKINIGLQVVSKREDGYHNIESVFLPVPLCDVLEIVPNETSRENDIAYTNNFYLKMSGATIPGNGADNICTKAFQLLHTQFRLPPTALFLHKNIPTGAGLGGGSSDGSFTLKLINQIYKLGIENSRLKEFAAMLGSDCPFFIDNAPAYVGGRGTDIRLIPLTLHGYHITIINPRIHVSTQEAYSMITPQTPKYNLLEALQQPVPRWKEIIVNDFERPLSAKYPELLEIKTQLYDAGAKYASMTGSGSSFYALSTKQLTLPAKLKSNFCWQGIL